ncbi:site-2 protease family protein [Cytophagaceae bacterium ABcell3]|nr:site-2 protease family protein [Cytophagaceae bacterium ABcell3]
MKWSWNIGRIAGIRILIHWTFLLLIAWIAFAEAGRGADLTGILLTVGFVLTIFGCVVLHELGHSLTARKYNIGTRKITLLPIGGVASLEKMPEDPKQELAIAVAGPAVNVAIALVLLFFIPFDQIPVEEEELAAISRENFLFSLFSVNVILVLFNIIPAFPMDGGRIFRALLALKMDRIKATNIASKTGQVVAIAFIFIGLFYNLFLVFIGIFVFYAAHAENLHVQHFDLLKGYTIRDAMMTSFMVLHPENTVKDAVDKLLAGSDQDFLVEDEGKPIGLVSTNNILAALKDNKMEHPVTEIMRRQFDTFQADDKLTEVFAAAQKSKSTFFPVLEGERVIGVINQNNVNEFLMVQSVLKQ